MAALDVPQTGGARVIQLLARGLGSMTYYHDVEEAAQARLAESYRLLHAAADDLNSLARRTPGFDMTLALGDSGPAVRLHFANEGLVTERLTRRGRGRAKTREVVGPAVDESEIVTELASILWSGDLGT